MWPDFFAAEEVIDLFTEKFLPALPIDVPEDDFRHRSTERWAAEDLKEFLCENWYEDYPEVLIGDYIDDSRYRSEKYRDHTMGPVYQTAQETAKRILFYFEEA